MKFSIITITYNSKTYLDETITSVLSQDGPCLEYIVVDGGSTDGTLDIIKRHAAADDRVRWISEPDKGIADAFNKGIGMATGDVVGILNSDDSYAPGALQAVAESAAAHPECDVFHGDMLRFQGDIPLFLLKPSDVAKNIWHEMPLNHPATFVTARAYRRVGGFDTSFRVAMDYDLLLRIYTTKGTFHYIERVLANMRYGGESDTRYLAGLKEVFRAAVRQGYARPKACFWFCFKAVLISVKNTLRRLGLFSIIRLHPKFHRVGGNAR
ncbi:glycosyltransferase family 2 protein [Geobacter sp. FeAm09]|uniref:glycosyltransferase family 2 protein n=1 Tax=Geobacter sp. FeAm09 TaxID=2597769 RepID=UPI00143D15AC|nr:glycosyltransferase family 2 protein [Geobacter sp. FeAm09]